MTYHESKENNNLNFNDPVVEKHIEEKKLRDNPSRDFKGIWIPKHIWLDERLTYFEKFLLAEIDSLCGERGCFASNEYLSKFFNERIRKIQEGLSKLKKLQYINYESFNGRTRIIRTTIYEKFSTPSMRNSAPHECRNPHPYNKEYNKVDNHHPLTPSSTDSYQELRKKLDDDGFSKKEIQNGIEILNAKLSQGSVSDPLQYLRSVLNNERLKKQLAEEKKAQEESKKKLVRLRKPVAKKLVERFKGLVRCYAGIEGDLLLVSMNDKKVTISLAENKSEWDMKIAQILSYLDSVDKTSC